MQFALNNPSVTVVGVGAGTAVRGDSLDGAYEFVTRHGADTAGMTMLYDVSFRAWRQWGVTTQPWVVLFDAQGNQIFSSPGRVDLGSVATALGL